MKRAHAYPASAVIIALDQLVPPPSSQSALSSIFLDRLNETAKPRNSGAVVVTKRKERKQWNGVVYRVMVSSIYSAIAA